MVLDLRPGVLVRDRVCFLGEIALQIVAVGAVGVRRGGARVQAVEAWRRGQAGCLLGELRRLLSLRIGIVLLLRLEK